MGGPMGGGTSTSLAFKMSMPGFSFFWKPLAELLTLYAFLLFFFAMRLALCASRGFESWGFP